MKLSKRLRKWRKNITTQTPLDYVLTLHEDIMGFADEVKALEVENKKLRKLVIAYADSFETYAALNNGEGPYYSGEDWLGLANEMRMELAECCGELGVEADG